MASDTGRAAYPVRGLARLAPGACLMMARPDFKVLFVSSDAAGPNLGAHAEPLPQLCAEGARFDALT